jgi:hypothetical protein
MHRIRAEVRRAVHALPSGAVVVHGAREDPQFDNGVDSTARDAAVARGLEVEAHLPDWGQGSGAAKARNAYVTTAEIAHFFPAPWSKGTWDAHRKAVEAGVPVELHQVRPLEVWTRRLRMDDDALILDVTRGTASRAWKRLLPGTSPADAQGQLDDLLERRSDAGAMPREIATQAAERSLPSIGEPWAPSWGLLKPALARLDEAERMRGAASAVRPVLSEEPEQHLAERARAEGIEDDAWTTYAAGFRAEMLTSWRCRRRAWMWALGLPELHLACTCSTERALRGRCHRVLVAGMLGSLGAVVRGELLGA